MERFVTLLGLLLAWIVLGTALPLLFAGLVVVLTVAEKVTR